VGDFNGDGKPDLAVADTPASSIGAIGTISIYLNQGGSFATPLVTTLENNNIDGTVIAGDVNGDGKTDLVVSTQFTNQVILVLLGNGDGTFQQLPEIAGSVAFLSGKIADFNNDGHPDLFLGGNGEPYLYLGNGDGTFVKQTIPIPTGRLGNYQSVLTGDFNDDKKLDAIAVDYGYPPSDTGSLDFFAGDGNGGLANPVFLQPPSITNPLTADAADFNHDGKLDLVIGGSGSYIALGNGDGTFQTAANQLIPLAVPPINESGVTNPDTYNVAAADFDQDGTPDVVALDSKTGMLSVFLNDGTGTFPNAKTTPYTFQLPANSFAMAVADINGDGLPDIIVSNYVNKTITLLLSKVNLAAATMTLTGSVNNALVGTPLTFTVNVTGTGSTPTGTVTLMDGATQLGQEPLDADGSVTFTASNLAAGVHSLIVSYSGDTHFAATTSAALNENITDFQVALTPATQSIAAGSSASYSLAITPVAGFTGTVSLSCSGLPANASCNAPSVPVSSGVASQTITITTAATTAAFSMERGLAVDACALLGLFSLCFGWRRHDRRALRLFTLLSLAMVTPLALGILGCGGNSPAKTVPGTPSGSSAITITATFTQAGVTATHTAAVTLVVQ
jgi:hypothetical protein